jgi:hypothetical protein
MTGRSVFPAGRSSVLWIDLEGPSEAEIADLAKRLQLHEETARRLGDTDSAPQLGDFEDYLHVTACGPGEDRQLVRIDCLVSKHWVVTSHDAPLEVLDTFRERLAARATRGASTLELLADLLEWMFESYFDAFEAVEPCSRTSTTSMAPGDVESKNEVLAGSWRSARDRSAEARADLHREMPRAHEARARVDREPKSAERFASLRLRLDEAVQAARDSRRESSSGRSTFSSPVPASGRTTS